MDMNMGRRQFLRLSSAAIGGIALAGLVPGIALADGGGGGGTDPHDTGQIGIISHYQFWYDDGSVGSDGTFSPTQGWDGDSVEWLKTRIRAMSGNLSDGSYAIIQNAANTALANARARTSSQHARIVGAGWNTIVYDGRLVVATSASRKTFATMMDNTMGTAQELPDAFGWGRPWDEGNPAYTWRNRVFDMAAADNPGTKDYVVVVIAVSDGEPPMSGKVGLVKDARAPWARETPFS
jgi:hypothetical protein